MSPRRVAGLVGFSDGGSGAYVDAFAVFAEQAEKLGPALFR